MGTDVARAVHLCARTLMGVAGFSLIVSTTDADAQSRRPLSPILSPPEAPLPRGAEVAISLTQAISLGLRDNRSVRSVYLDREVQKSGLFVVESRFLPRIDVAADLVRDRAGGISGTAASVQSVVSWRVPTGASVSFIWDRRMDLTSGSRAHADLLGFSASQPLLRGGGTDVNLAPVRIARLQERINHLGLKTSVSNTVSSIIIAYRDLLQTQEQVELAQRALERMQDLLVVNQTLIEAGRMAAADIVQTESSLANLQVAVLQAQQRKTSAQLALLQLLGADPHSNIVAGDKIAVERVPIALDRAIDVGLASRMDVLAQRLAIEQSRQDVVVARNDRLWDLSLTGSVAKRYGPDPVFGRDDARTDHSVGLQLNIAIGDFARHHAVLQTETNERVSEIRYEDLIQSVESQIRDAVQTVETGWLQLEAARRAKELAARALDLQREKFRVGRASNFEVLSFEADLSAADTQELTASITYLNALTALDQQIGSTLDTWQIDLND